MIGKRTMCCAGAALVGLAAAAPIVADSNIADSQKFAWGENVGWLNWADANARTQGVEVFANGSVQYLEGWIWGENIGWIDVGDGNAPYANTDNTNFGVNIDPTTGAMEGLAWGENVGWIVFTPLTVSSESPRWDHTTHRSYGYAWGENIGWINLDDMVRFICAVPGDFDYSGKTDVFDFGVLAMHFGSHNNPPFTNGDINGDGDVNVFDFSIFVLNFGDECP